MLTERPFILVVLFVLLSFPSLAQDTRWNGFMDVNWMYDHKQNNNSFNLGQLDLYVVSDVTDRVSFLAENTFTIASDASFKAAIERAIVKYEVNNYLNFLIGKHHTPVSYWNNTYHHGRVLQPTATRPMIFDYNIFSFHTTGLIINGDYIGKQNFGYQLMVGNGTVEHESSRDHDKYKSVSLTAHLSPLEELKVTGSGYYNKVARGVRTYRGILLTNDIDQTLCALSISYMPASKPFEFLGEWMYVNNRSAGMSPSSIGYYMYSGYDIKKFTPYIRYDYIHTADDDLFFVVDRARAATFGLRYTFSHLANIKTEWVHHDSRVNGISNRIQLQFGIGF